MSKLDNRQVIFVTSVQTWSNNKGLYLKTRICAAPRAACPYIVYYTANPYLMNLYQILVEQSPISMAMLDTEMNYIFASGQWRSAYNLPDNFIGQSIFNGFREISKDWNMKPWYEESGSVGGFIITTTDNFNAKKKSAELGIQLGQFKAAFETSAIGMAVVGLNGQWLTVNNSLVRLLGYEREELQSMTFQQVTHPDDIAADLDFVKRLLEGSEDSYQMEKRYIKKGGDTLWVLLSVSIVRNEQQVPLHFISQIIDISENKKLNHLHLSLSDKSARRISFELHENIAQTIASIKLYLSSSRASKIYSNKDLKGVDERLFNLIKEITILSNSVSPASFLQENVFLLIESLATKFNIEHGLKVRIVIDDNVKECNTAFGYHLYRIIEDHLKLSVVRNATEIAVHIHMNQHLEIDVHDNIPQSAISINSYASLLLKDIRTRIEIMDGTMLPNVPGALPGQYRISIPTPQTKIAI